MDSKAVFTQECHREEFMGLCINALPQIKKMIENVRKSGVEGMASLTMDTNGYFSFDFHNSRWKMVRIKEGDQPRVEYSYSEVVKMPEPPSQEKAVLGHLTENIMEIALVYADLQKNHPEICRIDSTTWKEMFVDWANEFEAMQAGTDWNQEDYLGDIGNFARHKILEYAGLVKERGKEVDQ